MTDKINFDARKAINALQKMNLHVVMLTGDNRHTATAVASQVGEINVDCIPSRAESKIAFSIRFILKLLSILSKDSWEAE